jgi:hypothetical protein
VSTSASAIWLAASVAVGVSVGHYLKTGSLSITEVLGVATFSLVFTFVVVFARRWLLERRDRS